MLPNLILGFGDKNRNVYFENRFYQFDSRPPKKKAKPPMCSKLILEFTLFTKTAETTLGSYAPEYSTHAGF